MKDVTSTHSRRRQASRPSYFKAAVLTLVMQASLLTSAGGADTEVPWESFTATTLTYEKVDSSLLLGQPTLLIITPSRAAGDSTKAWTQALRKTLDVKALRIRAVLTIDLPFFMSEEDAIGLAREAVPERYYDQTWILDSQLMEEALDIPAASKLAAVLILDASGTIIARVHGRLTDQRLEVIVRAVNVMLNPAEGRLEGA
ncbi:hypothetical protein [Vreelandella subglaciescola]|jgi:hypothetical protein|uniref:Uncharacterized protein n=1 Tax=Vreelandella subglaciescola TaxID=29571 RepID=A0A1M7GAY9_9GAMM|nr:hypothetical protein [Halomonas subglaciescola]SHM13059.1 hypothetical protein SAMN05878437_1376 [Halomonas subglaciescola]